MYTLSRREEQILLAICELKDDAYLVAIKKLLSDLLSVNWTVGTIHKPLVRLERNGLIQGTMGEATAVRGGRRKKLYKITPKGLTILTEQKRLNEAMWANFSEYKFGS